MSTFSTVTGALRSSERTKAPSSPRNVTCFDPVIVTSGCIPARTRTIPSAGAALYAVCQDAPEPPSPQKAAAASDRATPTYHSRPNTQDQPGIFPSASLSRPSAHCTAGGGGGGGGGGGEPHTAVAVTMDALVERFPAASYASTANV